MKNNTVKFIDLFAGLGGIRLGFENAFKSLNYNTECVMTSEIKPYAIDTLVNNFEHKYIVGDIFDVKNNQIPDFDFLLGGFPCQPFSSSGKRQGFVDTRGTLFFEIERILSEKKPYGFILENVEGLVKHDLEFKTDKIGKTLTTILDKLKNELNYNVSWKVFDSLDFGLPQSRKRIFIVGTKNKDIDLNGNEPFHKTLDSIFENGLDTIKSDFVDKILANFDLTDLYGKSIKDKRGGDNNIHSWDIGAKGFVSDDQILLLNKIFKERRRKQWAIEIGIDWMDGMPLTLKQINTFMDITENELLEMLEDLTKKGYLKFEFPKKLVKEQMLNGVKTFRIYDESKPKGYNIVAGKLSFEINKILNPKDIAPTLVATDVSRLAVPDGNGLRKLTIREGLRLFGYPEWYNINCKESDAFDLLGNTVAVPVVEFVAEKIAKSFIDYNSNHSICNEMPVCSL
ncbi:MAG: DNA (cytosine-5-)-methyltransferase [Flavobacterium sp.]|uniref:DNA (cytosine-5-)-methyltransferase n=1 Tax=Flavobacterium sp. TaxID=239 RepID=UPI0032632163